VYIIRFSSHKYTGYRYIRTGMASSHFSQYHHQNQNFFCNNCGKYGNHTYSNCKFPTTSIGLIVARPGAVANSYEFLMIRRKDTLGFVDFVRGKYTFADFVHLRNIIDEMTVHEKRRLLTSEFKQLWTEMWGGYTNSQFTGEEAQSRDKFNRLKNGVTIRGGDGRIVTLRDLIENSPTQWQSAEWGFPKGRRNNQECDIDCAIRENNEETGYAVSKSDILSNIAPFEEVFIGSNFKSYKHKYFIAVVQNEMQPTSAFQRSEVSKLKWMPYETCIKKIRPYNIEKLKMLSRIHSMLTTYRIVKV